MTTPRIVRIICASIFAAAGTLVVATNAHATAIPTTAAVTDPRLCQGKDFTASSGSYSYAYHLRGVGHDGTVEWRQDTYYLYYLIGTSIVDVYCPNI